MISSFMRILILSYKQDRWCLKMIYGFGVIIQVENILLIQDIGCRIKLQMLIYIWKLLHYLLSMSLKVRFLDFKNFTKDQDLLMESSFGSASCCWLDLIKRNESWFQMSSLWHWKWIHRSYIIHLWCSSSNMAPSNFPTPRTSDSLYSNFHHLLKVSKSPSLPSDIARMFPWTFWHI